MSNLINLEGEWRYELVSRIFFKLIPRHTFDPFHASSFHTQSIIRHATQWLLIKCTLLWVLKCITFANGNWKMWMKNKRIKYFMFYLNFRISDERQLCKIVQNCIKLKWTFYFIMNNRNKLNFEERFLIFVQSYVGMVKIM